VSFTRQDAENAVTVLLGFIGEDVTREGLHDTPARVVRAFEEMTDGLRKDEDQFLSKVCRTFDAEYDEMVVVRNIPLISLCEHHLLPFTGVAHVGYIPGEKKKVIGLSKIPRLIKFYATRPQIQEKLAVQTADALEKVLEPKGVGVWISAEHQCMSCRGIRVRGTTTDTSVLRGVMREKPEARAEFLSLVRQS
jgi:GTP cyclohydrolase I